MIVYSLISLLVMLCSLAVAALFFVVLLKMNRALSIWLEKNGEIKSGAGGG